jgi:hypothetical protein
MTTLRPVLELAPSSYSTHDRPRPSGPVAEYPDGWFRYWSESLGDAGVHGLRPWTSGSWLVTIDQFVEPDLLRTLIKHALPDIAHLSSEEMGALAGGYVLSHGNATVLPGCCGDLGNLYDWRRAANEANETWQSVVIGHPWIYVRSSGEILEFTEPTERADPEGLAESLRLSRDDLLNAIAAASEERDRFAERLTPVVQAFNPKLPAAEIVSLLVGV